MIIEYTENRWDLVFLDLFECDPNFDPQIILDWLADRGYVGLHPFRKSVSLPRSYFATFGMRIYEEDRMLLKLTFC